MLRVHYSIVKYCQRDANDIFELAGRKLLSFAVTFELTFELLLLNSPQPPSVSETALHCWASEQGLLVTPNLTATRKQLAERMIATASMAVCERWECGDQMGLN